MLDQNKKNEIDAILSGVYQAEDHQEIEHEFVKEKETNMSKLVKMEIRIPSGKFGYLNITKEVDENHLEIEIEVAQQLIRQYKFEEESKSTESKIHDIEAQNQNYSKPKAFYKGGIRPVETIDKYHLDVDQFKNLYDYANKSNRLELKQVWKLSLEQIKPFIG